MEFNLSTVLSIASIIFVVLNFALGRKDKSNNDTQEEAYTQGKLDQKLANIIEKLDKIEKKLDYYDKEIDERIDTALMHHLREYHKKGDS